jgi:Fe-S cluster assembly protein SufB
LSASALFWLETAKVTGNGDTGVDAMPAKRLKRLEENRAVRQEAIMPAVQETIDTVATLGVEQYKYGFVTDIESDLAPKGLDETTIAFISAKKNEPDWMLEWRLDAYRRWLTMQEPEWARVDYPQIDFQDIHYYAAPKNTPGPSSLDEVDPELLKTYAKLGIPLREQEILAGVKKPVQQAEDEDASDNVYKSGRVAVDAVFDSVSVVTTFRAELAKAGVIFCSISEAMREHPELVKKYLGSVVPVTDNFYATLNSAVFTDGSFVFVPKGVRCPMELSTYFRINEKNTGQFERTLIIAEEGAYVSYLEGCTAPQRDENQLHAAVVELIALDDAEIKYSTVQNWYPGDANGKGGIYNFVTKRGDCRGRNSKISWTQVETGSAITWKYPSCILRGDNSRGEFYSIAVSNGMQQVDSGTKMIHLGKNTSSRIISKGISAGRSSNTYRGQVSINRKATNARNFTQCDSLLIGNKCGAHTVPYIEARNGTAKMEHEATTSKISEDQLFYAMQRGIPEEEAIALIVNGFVKEVLQELPMEFAVEAQKLIGISLEGSVG